jgi:hypothetical protein
MQEGHPIEEYVTESDFEDKNAGGLKGKLERLLETKYFWIIVIILVAITSFCFGRISKIQSQREPVRVVSETNLPNPLYIKEGTGPKTNSLFDQSAAVIKSQSSDGTQTQPSPKATAGAVVGSKNGTKYHLPTCPGAKQISEKNKITFNSIEEAKAKGYTPASNCKGLK